MINKQKIKTLSALIVPPVAFTGVAIAIPTAITFAVRKSVDYHVDLEEEVTKQGVSVASSNIVAHQASSITLNLPEKKTLASATLAINGQEVSAQYVTIDSPTIKIAADGMVGDRVTIKEVTLVEATSIGLINNGTEDSTVTIGYNTPADLEKTYLEYSLDEGKTWTKADPTGSPTTVVKNGGKLLIRGKGWNSTSSDKSLFSYGRSIKITSGQVTLTGSINSLVDYELPDDQITYNYGMFKEGFSFSSGLVGISPQFLPATNLSANCYYYMFRGCENLKNTPLLPATALAESCYESMFWNCKGLTSISKISASTLAKRSCCCMFLTCEKLKIAESGERDKFIFTCPATEGLEDPVSNMFNGTATSQTVTTPIAGHSYYYTE